MSLYEYDHQESNIAPKELQLCLQKDLQEAHD